MKKLFSALYTGLFGRTEFFVYGLLLIVVFFVFNQSEVEKAMNLTLFWLAMCTDAIIMEIREKGDK